MDQQNQLFGLTIDPQSKRFLSETAKWGKFLSIIGFIGCAFIAIFGIIMALGLSNASQGYNEFGGGNPFAMLGPAMAVIMLLMALLYFIPCLYLFRFSGQMSVALSADDQAALNKAFENLKSVFKFIGILTIIVLSFYILAFLIGLMAMM